MKVIIEFPNGPNGPAIIYPIGGSDQEDERIYTLLDRALNQPVDQQRERDTVQVL